ncbi:MAG: class I SAM-dependent methyltransferase [Bacteroidales bacterium]|nr:class I SAM-dependent methyltransferase [Bacteroidales bacterium]
MHQKEDFQNPWTDADVEAHWDAVAHLYVKENDKVKDTHDQRFLFSLPQLDLYCSARVLNISSRDGEAASYINKFEPSVEVTNAEISQKLMDVATSLNPDISQVKINSYSTLPFANESFDRVLCLETLEHVENPVLFLEELHRVSIPDAKMVLSCPPATSEIPYRIYTALFGGHGEGPHRFPSSKEVKKWLKLTGWELTLHKGTVLLPVGPKWAKKAGESIIEKFQGTFIAELGIRQFYVCKKS